MKSLNLGCGTDVRPGWVNLDAASLPGVDVVHDLNRMPLPFDDGAFSLIHAKDVLEHVNYVEVLRELHRILASGGILKIQVPHFTSADNYIDPTHIRQFSIRTFDFFVANHPEARPYYFDFAFAAIERRRINFFCGPLVWDYLVEPLVNLHFKIQKYYELTFLSRLFPAQNVEIVMRK